MSPAHLPATFIRPRINLGYGNDWPDGINTLPELIEFAAKHNPEHIFGLQARPNGAGCGATWGSGNSSSFCEITFFQLRRVIERASAWLVNSGATTGRTRRIDRVSPVAIFLKSDVTIFMYMAALLRIGSPVSVAVWLLQSIVLTCLSCASRPSFCLLVFLQCPLFTCCGKHRLRRFSLAFNSREQLKKLVHYCSPIMTSSSSMHLLFSTLINSKGGFP